MKFPSLESLSNPSVPSSPQRLQFILLAGMAVLLLAYVIRVRPMQAEIEDLLATFESETSVTPAPQVVAEDAAYVMTASDALPKFYADLEDLLKSAGLELVTRQARIEEDPRFPASSLIYESRCRGKWPEITNFLSAVRASKPRIQIQRLVISREDRPGNVEIFFQARALALATDPPTQ